MTGDLLDVFVALVGVVAGIGTTGRIDQEETVLGITAFLAPVGVAPEIESLSGEFGVVWLGVVGTNDARGVDGGAMRVGDYRGGFQEGDLGVGMAVREGESRRYWIE